MNTKLTIAQSYSLFLTDYPDVLTTKDTREILGVSTKTHLHLIHTGQLHSIKVGRSYRIPKLYLLQFLEIISDENIG